MRKLYLILWVLLAHLYGRAQDDAHYWTSEFCAGGIFFPGATVANNYDSGVYFFNPALFSNTHRASISASASLYQFESINIHDGAGSHYALKSSITSSIPQILSGSFVLKLKKPIILAWAVIKSPNLEFSASQRRDEKINVLNEMYSPGPENFIGQYVQQNVVSESSFQLATGFSLSKKLSLGFTMMGDAHKQDFNINFAGRAIQNLSSPNALPPISNSEYYYLANYNHIGFRLKVGLAYDEGIHHFGLTITSPTAHIAGNATIVGNQLINRMPLGDSTNFFNVLADARQENLSTKWKMPLSISLGYIRDLYKGKFYVTAEYFFKVSPYNIITPRDEYFIRIDSGQYSSNNLQLTDGRRAVLNIALGGSFNMTEKITGFVSARTDFSFAEPGLLSEKPGFISYMSYWNNIRWQVGGNIKQKNSNLRAGFTFSYGTSNHYPQEVNLANPSEDNFLTGVTTEASASHFSAGVIISFLHNF